MKLSPLIIVIVAVVIILGLAVFYRYKPKKLNQGKVTKQWQEIQSLCKEKTTWSKALIKSDALLSKCLKRRKYKGKSMGEKMVSAQRKFSENDSIWKAHNLTKKVIAGTKKGLRENEVKAALIAYRQALRDLGALPQNAEK